METFTTELNTPKAPKLIDDLVDKGIIPLKTNQPSWFELWGKLDARLSQTEPDITEAEIMAEITAYRLEKRAAQSVDSV
jgi:hypothetical protein